jgi:hypothetical protein
MEEHETKLEREIERKILNDHPNWPQAKARWLAEKIVRE